MGKNKKNEINIKKVLKKFCCLKVIRTFVRQNNNKN